MGTTSIDIEALGLSRDEIAERIVQRAADRLLEGWGVDEDGDTYRTDSRLARKLQAAIAKQIDAKVEELAEKTVLPMIGDSVENLCLQETNRWGEKTGEKLTFREYLVKRAEQYMLEDVNFEGKPQGRDSYSWSKASTRVAFMVNSHLHYSIESAMQEAVANANSQVKDGIEKAVKIALGKIVTSLKVTTETRTK